MKRTSWLVIASAMLLLLPRTTVRAQNREQIDRINDSVQVLRDLTESPDDRIPQYLLERAEAVIVIPDMIRGGFVIGAKHGKGIVSVRNRATDRWSPPGFVKMTGGSVGWQIGAQSVDLVLLVMNQNGVRKLLDNRFTIGGELSATAGPVGRSASAATDVSLASEILTYSRAKGLFAGATFEGVALRADDDDNQEFYGAEVSLRDVVLEPARNLRVPLVAASWTDYLRQASTPSAVAPREVDRSYDRRNDVDRDAARRQPSWDDSSMPLTVAVVAEHPDRYYGKRVSLTASVNDVYSPTSFSLETDPTYSSGRGVIVINPQPASRVEQTDRVTVSGTIYKFNRGDVEKRLGGWRWDAPNSIVESFKDRPVIIADSIRITGREMVRSSFPAAPPAPSYTTPPAGFTGRLVAVRDVAHNPKPLYERQVMVTASVENLYSRSVFTVDDDQLMSTGQTVVIVAPTIARPVTGNMSVSVVGEVMKFKKGDIEKRIRGYKLELSDDVEKMLKDRPVIVATSIRTKDGEELVGSKVIK